MDFIEPGYKYHNIAPADNRIKNLTRTPETELRAYIFQKNVLAIDNFSTNVLISLKH